MKQFFIILFVVSGMAQASTDVDHAKEARKLLLEQPNVGRGHETICKSVEQPPKITSKGPVNRPPKTVCKKIEWDNVLLAIKQPLLPFKLVKAKLVKGKRDECISLDPQFEIGCIVNQFGQANGLNTHFIVKPYGYKVYAIRRLGRGVEGVYSPYSDELKTPIVIDVGKKYLNSVLEESISKLRERQVKSLAFPGQLVADLARKELVHNLALIEHIDVDRFKTEDIGELVDQVYVTLALNKENAYNLAPSSASANGLFQVIPQTYHSMVVTYPAARLIFNYREGTHNHVNAAMTAFVLLDHDLSLLPKKDRKIVYEDKRLYREYSASTYNGGPSCPNNQKRLGLCARQLLEKFGEFIENNPSEENRTYVRKINKVAALRRT